LGIEQEVVERREWPKAGVVLNKVETLCPMVVEK